MTLTVVENNLHEVLVDERPLLFHIPSTAIFEADRLTTDILRALRTGEHDAGSLADELATEHPAGDVQSALSELQVRPLLRMYMSCLEWMCST